MVLQPHQLDVSGLEVEFPPLVDVSAGEARGVDAEGPDRHVRLKVILHVGARVSDLSDGVASRHESVPHQPDGHS